MAKPGASRNTPPVKKSAIAKMAPVTNKGGKNNAGASMQNMGFRDQISSYAAHHQLVAVETLMRLWANPMSSVLTWLVIAIALTLPGALWISLDNLSQLSGRFQASGSITVYLVPGTAIKDGQATQKTIAGLSHVVDTRFIDADTALEEFRTTSGLKDALDLLPSNPLPPVIVVEPQLGTPQAQVLALGKSIERLPFVDVVELDTAWLERLLALLALSERIIWVMGALLALAIVLVVGNTIRLSIAARVDEIRVVKLVGGTNAWVRRPFLYTGLWFGMVGGLMAWVLLAICWLLVSGPVEDLAQLYGSTFSLAPLSASAALFLLFSAMFLGWLGAWWSVHRHLDQIEP